MKGNKGYILMSVIAVLSLVILSLFVALTFTRFSGQILQRQLTYQGQALNVAAAGLVEGQDWFRRQSTGLVSSFNPYNDNVVDPPRNDTDEEPPVGQPRAIIRNFEISKLGRVWGRYELTAGPSPAGVIDLSTNRGKTTPGALWQVESKGIIFVRNDASKKYNEAPNRVIAQKTVRNEIQRLTITHPGNAKAAICIESGANVVIGNKAKILGQQESSVASKSGTVMAPPAGSYLNGVNGTTTNAAMVFTENTVFGLTSGELRDLADIRETYEGNLPNPLPNMQLIYLEPTSGTATFDLAKPLKGSGILYVKGALSISGASSWNGLIYATGNVTVSGPAMVSGSIVAAGAGTRVTVNGTADYGTVLYDKFIIEQATKQIGVYRVLRPLYVP